MNSDSDDIIDPNLVDYEDEDLENGEEISEEGDLNGDLNGEEEDINDYDDDEEEEDVQPVRNGKGRTLKTVDADIEDDMDEVVRKKFENKVLMNDRMAWKKKSIWANLMLMKKRLSNKSKMKE